MTESSDQSNPHQSSRKPKNSIKNIIYNFFKPGIETQLHITNMVLNDIPTQTTPVFIHIRQGRERIDTQAVKIVDNKAVWQDEIVIDSRVPSIDSQQPHTQQPQRPQNNNTNTNNPSQQSNSTSQRSNLTGNVHDYDNYDNYDNYEYEQPDENDNPPPNNNNKESNTIPDATSASSSKNGDKSDKSERSERRKEKKERKELERREKKEKKEKVKREKKENKEKERKEKRERKPQSSNNSSFCLEFTFRLEDVSGRSSTIYGKSVLDLVQITTATDWEYRAILHECNYESVFSCLISINTKKRKSSAMVESLPPLPTSNNNLNIKNQNGMLLPPAKFHSSLNTKYDQIPIYRNDIERERSFTDRPIRKIQIHESVSLDGINNYTNSNSLVENTDSELIDNLYFDDNNNSDAISQISSKRNRASSSNKSSNVDNNNNNKRSFNISKPHNHTKNSHGHRRNDSTIKSAASTIIIPIDQNGNDEEFEEKLPFKVQKDKLERLSDQVDDIINNVFYGFSED